MPVITSPLSPLPPMAHTYSLASHQNGSLSVFKSFSKERVGVRSCESLPPLRGGQGEYIPPPSSPAQSASTLWKTTISCPQNYSKSIKFNQNLSPFKRWQKDSKPQIKASSDPIQQQPLFYSGDTLFFFSTSKRMSFFNCSVSSLLPVFNVSISLNSLVS